MNSRQKIFNRPLLFYPTSMVKKTRISFLLSREMLTMLVTSEHQKRYQHCTVWWCRNRVNLISDEGANREIPRDNYLFWRERIISLDQKEIPYLLQREIEKRKMNMPIPIFETLKRETSFPIAGQRRKRVRLACLYQSS